MADYIYNPLSKLDLQKVGDGSTPPTPITVDDELSPASTNPVQNKVITDKLTEMQQDTRKKVSKFYTSITELEVSEIGEYQGASNNNFTEGYFYKRNEPVEIQSTGVQSSVTLYDYLDFYKGSTLYRRQYYISRKSFPYDFMSQTDAQQGVRVLMFSTSFLVAKLQRYTNYAGEFFIYPFAVVNGSWDYENPIVVDNGQCYYKGNVLNFSESSQGAQTYIGMEIESPHLFYVWFPLFPQWIGLLLDSAQVHAAYSANLSVFDNVDIISRAAIPETTEISYQEYTFEVNDVFRRVNTQPPTPSNFHCVDASTLQNNNLDLLDTTGWNVHDLLILYDTAASTYYYTDSGGNQKSFMGLGVGSGCDLLFRYCGSNSFNSLNVSLII